MNKSITPIPASSLVIIRNSSKGMDVLLLKRNRDLAYLGGAWVFPGGKIEQRDGLKTTNNFDYHSAKIAVIRETKEECGLTFNLNQLIPMSQWITPEGMPKRFSTFFFITGYNDRPIIVDGSEITDYRWINPVSAVISHRKGLMEMPPPVYVTLCRLSKYMDIEACLSDTEMMPPVMFKPKLAILNQCLCSVYEGDVSYDDLDFEKKGKKHRLIMDNKEWIYQNNEL